MPKIDLCFQGYIRDANVKIAYNIKSGDEVDVSKMPRKELAEKLNSGELSIALVDLLYEDCDETSIEISDYE